MSETRPRVSVCMNTYKRPPLLDVAVDHLLRQAVDFEFEIIVVDNDATGSGRAAVEAQMERAGRLGIGLRYEIEPIQNIAMARNRAVAAGTGELVAFVDDDERAEPGWLAALVSALEATNVDGVFGPVLPEYPDAFPRWIAEADFLPRMRFETGTPIPALQCRSGNALLVRDQLVCREGPFDQTYGLTGGEDSDLFGFMEEQGARFAWADDAIVHELQGMDRADWKFYVRRAYRSGWGRMNRARAERGFLRGVLPVLGLALPSLLRLSFESRRAVGNPRAMGVLIAMAFANMLGKLGCLFGMVYEPYK